MLFKLPNLVGSTVPGIKRLLQAEVGKRGPKSRCWADLYARRFGQVSELGDGSNR